MSMEKQKEITLLNDILWNNLLWGLKLDGLRCYIYAEENLTNKWLNDSDLKQWRNST